jgi:hypothetical protein
MDAAAAPAGTRLDRAVVVFLVLFLLVFPKGGVKVGGVPLTWGFLALAPLLLMFLASAAGGRSLRVLPSRLLVLAGLVPFQLVVFGSFLAYGFKDPGFAISMFVTFAFLPLVLLVAPGAHLDRIDLPHLLRWIRGGILAVAVYGIFLFFWKLGTGDYIEIPFLTVNAADVGTLGDKHNNRGGIFKLISTYNNGNIYGISLIMLLPLYTWMERSPWKRGVVKMSLVLSLSRTAWAGLLAYELIQRLWVRRPRVRTFVGLGVAFVLMAGGVLWMLSLLDRDPSFLFDKTLGGRHFLWAELDRATILPGRRFRAIEEITYLSVLNQLGVVGLGTFLLAMAVPLGLFWSKAVAFHDTAFKRAVMAGLLLYFFMSTSDGGILFIPINAFLWFLVSLLLTDNPGFASMDAEAPAPLASPVEESERDAAPLPLAPVPA